MDYSKDQEILDIRIKISDLLFKIDDAIENDCIDCINKHSQTLADEIKTYRIILNKKIV